MSEIPLKGLKAQWLNQEILTIKHHSNKNSSIFCFVKNSYFCKYCLGIRLFASSSHQLSCEEFQRNLAMSRELESARFPKPSQKTKQWSKIIIDQRQKQLSQIFFFIYFEQRIDGSSFLRNVFLPRSFVKIEAAVPFSFLFCCKERRSFFRSYF